MRFPPEKFKVGGIEFDFKVTLTIILGVLLPFCYYYGFVPFRRDSSYEILRRLALTPYNQFALFFFVPVVFIVAVFRESPTKYGLCVGRWREGLLWTLGACAVLAVILWFVAQRPEMQRWYQKRAQESVWRLAWLSGIEMFGWEFIWRGFYLFALARVLGPGPAIFLQAVPFAFLHFGKPAFETVTTIFGGAGFGFVAWRSQSFIPAFLIHWFMLTFLVFAATL